ncbi:MAG: HRDC domain-containing protein, partial [Candidatus Aminicenantes bacterium]|nr:HRDC domain-containing protein [Candidatus Aminicenantes bacterium]
MNKKKISYKYISVYSDLETEANALLNENEIGVDLESDSLFHYKEKICLLQISTDEKNLLIDPLAIKDLSPLAQVFSSKDIRKILHGSDYDIRSLYRDFKIEVCSLFDTQIAARILGSNETGLASLLSEHFNINLEKKYQKRDWSKRPISDSMLTYGVYDTCYLIPLSRILENQLTEKNRIKWFEEECELLTRVRFNQGNEEPLFLKFKGARKLAPRNLAVLEAILNLREELAMKKDRPPFKVLRNDQILKIATERPSGLNELRYLSEGQVKKMGRMILEKIEEALKIPEKELPGYPKPELKPAEPELNKNIKALKDWRSKTAVKLELDPSLLCTNAQIQSLVQACPEDVSRLRKMDILKNWQVNLFGKEVCRLFRDMGTG